jgi:hypothetical protein
MILCPIAIVTGCKKCFLFKICPIKGIIGDFKKEKDKSSNTSLNKGGLKGLYKIAIFNDYNWRKWIPASAGMTSSALCHSHDGNPEKSWTNHLFILFLNSNTSF